jgi:hypothetical protein
MLMAIAAEHDLELKQYDVTNAFVHATIDREIYIRMPHGYQKPGTILRVNKALYGLRISPLLWQKEFTSTLKTLSFQSVLHEPCCIIRDRIIIFFYVDDIILAYARLKEEEAQQAIKQLQERYTITQTCQQASQPAGSLRLAGLVFSEAIGWLAGLIG